MIRSKSLYFLFFVVIVCFSVTDAKADLGKIYFIDDVIYNNNNELQLLNRISFAQEMNLNTIAENQIKIIRAKSDGILRLSE